MSTSKSRISKSGAAMPGTSRKRTSKQGASETSVSRSKTSKSPISKSKASKPTTPEPLSQSASERRTAEAQARVIIEKHAPTQVRLVAAMRRLLQKLLPSAHEMVYEYRSWFIISYSPSGHGYEGVLAIRGSADGVKLSFNRAKELKDPEKLLRGTGTQVRSIDIETASALARPAVASLIDQAIAHNDVPFASTGRGPVVIRSAEAKPRQKRSTP